MKRYRAFLLRKKSGITNNVIYYQYQLVLSEVYYKIKNKNKLFLFKN